MPRVSIITPVHDRPQFLEEAVASIQHQSYDDWEHIIVDDGSTNIRTQEIFKRINGLPKVVFYRTENKGLGGARNFGIERATGEYIVTLDDDDKWHPEFIKTALDVFANQPNAGVVSAWMQEFGHSKRLIKTTGGGIKNFLIENNSVHGMFKKEYWAVCGKYDEKMVAYEDWDLWLRITAMGYSVEVVKQPFFFYRIHRYTSLLKQIQGRHLEIFRYMVEKNKSIYQEYLVEAICLLEERTVNLQKAFESGDLVSKLKRIINPHFRQL